MSRSSSNPRKEVSQANSNENKQVNTKETWWPSSNTLSECYNNADVGVPLWLIEPRDKHPHQEYDPEYPEIYPESPGMNDLK